MRTLLVNITFLMSLEKVAPSDKFKDWNLLNDYYIYIFTKCTINTRTGKGLRITRPGKGGQILPLPAISASIRARITKLGKRKDMPVNFLVYNFGDLGSIF